MKYKVQILCHHQRTPQCIYLFAFWTSLFLKLSNWPLEGSILISNLVSSRFLTFFLCKCKSQLSVRLFFHHLDKIIVFFVTLNFVSLFCQMEVNQIWVTFVQWVLLSSPLGLSPPLPSSPLCSCFFSSFNKISIFRSKKPQELQWPKQAGSHGRLMLEAGGAAPVSNVVWTVADLFFISLIPPLWNHMKKKTFWRRHVKKPSSWQETFPHNSV